jgi:hypothetical protein
MNSSWAEVQDSFMQAHQHSGRAEPLFMIASHYYDRKDWILAYLFSLRASQIKYPRDAILWVNAPKDVAEASRTLTAGS